MIDPSPTPAEQIAYLATQIMGWTRRDYTWNVIENDHSIKPCDKCGSKEHTGHNYKWAVVCEKCGTSEDVERSGWNPLSDWNQWRQIEEKIMAMESDVLFCLFAEKVCLAVGRGNPVWAFAEADLFTRAAALISAHQELYGKQ